MADEHTHVDSVTGTATTGHEWDGIRELNTPLPRWWLWLLYLTIIWAIGYWVVYPAWPLVSSFTTGTFGWYSRVAVATDLNDLKSLRAPLNTACRNRTRRYQDRSATGRFHLRAGAAPRELRPVPWRAAAAPRAT